MEPSIVWKGDRILCMKSVRTLQCKICMVERTTILKKMDEDQGLVINDNSDIFSSCKCGSQFHKFFRNVTTTLRTRSSQKKVNSCNRTKQKRKNRRFSFSIANTPTIHTPQCQPCNSAESASASSYGEPASPCVTPVFYSTTQIYIPTLLKPKGSSISIYTARMMYKIL